MKILVVGDVVGENGCEFLADKLPMIKREEKIDFCIVNGENSAKGNGISKSSAEFLLSNCADFITTGNHVFKKSDIHSFLDESKRIVRPFNMHASNPGCGVGKVDFGRYKIGIINLLGQAFMSGSDNPFDAADRALELIKDCKIKIVDFHAEATGEKRALGFYLDGRVSVFFGTHTHVQTADASILPKGTGYITDVGMCGPKDSVLGIESEIIIKALKTGMPQRFDVSSNPCALNGCIFEIDENTFITKSVKTVNLG